MIYTVYVWKPRAVSKNGPKEAVLAEVQEVDLSTFFVAEIASIIRKLPTK